MFNSIEEIRAYAWAGNYREDAPAFAAIDAFAARASTPQAEGIEAHRIASRDGMGEDCEYSPADFEEWRAEHQPLIGAA